MARAGAVDGFGQREAVGIVLAADFTIEEMPEIPVKGVSVQHPGVGVFDEAGARGEGAGNADADGAGGAEVRFGFVDQRSDAVEDGLIAAGVGGGALAVDFGALCVESDDFGFGPAEIDPDSQGGRA
jgi:hypothetical protein